MSLYRSQALLMDYRLDFIGIIICILFMSAGAQHGAEVWYDIQMKN